MIDTYSFRTRFALPDTVRIDIGESSWTLPVSTDNASAELRAARVGHIRDSDALVLLGAGYESAASALGAAERYRDLLTVAFARAQVPVDFGDRAPQSYITNAGIEMLEARGGRRVLQDVHGTQVFQSDPAPTFISFAAKGLVRRSGTSVKSAISDALRAAPQLEPKFRIAYDLYAASAAMHNSDARSLMLMMGLETMIEPHYRSSAAQQLVQQLTDSVSNCDLSRDDVNSMIGALRWFKYESIGQAGRRLARTLNGMQYAGFDPVTFFNRCYEIRSSLVHGTVPRVDRKVVNSVVTQLELFVADLISVPFLGMRESASKHE